MADSPYLGFDITIYDKQVRRGLEMFPRKVTLTVSQVLNRHKPAILKKLRRYPAPLPYQKYVRTYRLQRSWQVYEAAGDNLQRLVFESIFDDYTSRYAKWVMSRPTQALIHRGRWQTVEGVAEEFVPKVYLDMRTETQRLLDQLGG